MASKSTMKESENEDMGNCAWCDRYGSMGYSQITRSVVYGRPDKIIEIKRFCDAKCLKKWALQETSIDLRQKIVRLKEYLPRGVDRYKDCLNKIREGNVSKDNGEMFFLQIKYIKTAIDFYESLLRREKRDILHMKRYKCLKTVGDLYESFQKFGELVSTEKHQDALSLIHYFNDHDGVKGATMDIDTFGTD